MMYDCVIAPERWGAVIDAIRLEHGFALGLLGVNVWPDLTSSTTGPIALHATAGFDEKALTDFVSFKVLKNSSSFGVDQPEFANSRWENRSSSRKRQIERDGDAFEFIMNGANREELSTRLPSSWHGTLGWLATYPSAAMNRLVKSTRPQWPGCASSRRMSVAP